MQIQFLSLAKPYKSFHVGNARHGRRQDVEITGWWVPDTELPPRFLEKYFPELLEWTFQPAEVLPTDRFRLKILPNAGLNGFNRILFKKGSTFVLQLYFSSNDPTNVLRLAGR